MNAEKRFKTELNALIDRLIDCLTPDEKQGAEAAYRVLRSVQADFERLLRLGQARAILEEEEAIF